MLKLLRDSLLSLAFPQSCVLCRSSVESFDDGRICGDCWARARVLTGKETACFKCGRLLEFKFSDVRTLCRLCDDHQYDIAFSAGVYEGPLRAVVLDLKKTPFLAKKAREIFSEAFNDSRFYDSTLLVPVPLSRKRRLERGFNQAEILAKHLFRHTGIRYDREILLRTSHAPMHRAGMDRKARTQSVQKAFGLMNASRVKDQVVLLIDDVFTSGATASGCAGVLKKAGAERVNVFTFARTL